MAQRYYNPFARTELFYPPQQKEVYDLYTQTGGKKIVDKCPFPRMVDLWFAGISLAIHKKLQPVNLSGENIKFHDGSVFDNDEDRWRVQVLLLIAIAIEDSVDIVSQPRRIIDIANSLAAAGVPHIVVMLRDGGEDEIWNLSESLCKLLPDSNG